jgi:hypothetical protein
MVVDGTKYLTGGWGIWANIPATDHQIIVHGR